MITYQLIVVQTKGMLVATKKKVARKVKACPEKRVVAEKSISQDVEDMSQEDKAGLVTVEYILSKFVDVVEGVGPWAQAKPAQVLKALQLLGDWKKMFVQHKKVDIDIRQVIGGMPTETLKGIIDVEATEVRSDKDSGSRRLSDGNRGHARV